MKKAKKIKRLKADLAIVEARASRYLRGLHKIKELNLGPDVTLVLDEALGNTRHLDRVIRESYAPLLKKQLNSPLLSGSALLDIAERTDQ